MAVQWHPVAGIVNLHEQGHRLLRSAVVIPVGRCAQQGQATVVLFIEAIALQLFRVNDAGQHERGAI